jgi:hypothetical protein
MVATGLFSTTSVLLVDAGAAAALVLAALLVPAAAGVLAAALLLLVLLALLLLLEQPAATTAANPITATAVIDLLLIDLRSMSVSVISVGFADASKDHGFWARSNELVALLRCSRAVFRCRVRVLGLLGQGGDRPSCSQQALP